MVAEKVMVKKLLLAVLLLAVLVVPVQGNSQGFESIDCNTRAGKDTFSPTEDVCIKQTTTEQAGSCSDPNEIIAVYVLNYKTPANTLDGSFFYTAYRSLIPYVTKTLVTVNSDRSFYWNLGKYSVGSYDIAQGSNDQYSGGCLDELGSPLVSAGFDVVSTGGGGAGGTPCTSDQSCGTGYYCANIQPNGLGTCTVSSTPSCTPDWHCGPWAACGFGSDPAGTQSRACDDWNNCGTTINKPALTQSCSEVSTQPITCQDIWQCTCTSGQQFCNYVGTCERQGNKPSAAQTCASSGTHTTTTTVQPSILNFTQDNLMFGLIILVIALLVMRYGNKR